MSADSGGTSSESHNDLSGTSSRDVVQAGSVTGGVHFHQDAGGRRLPTPRQLPAGVHGFVNRSAELAELDALVADGTVVSLHVIAGTAGAGKTSLALRWAHRVKDRFPDGQLFVNLRGYDAGEPVTAEQALRGFLRALGVPAAEVPGDVDGAAALYRSLLAERRVLVLLDNAATAGQVRPLLPGSGDSLVLVTSRSRLSGLAVRDGARRITLGTLPEPEAVALLQAVTAAHRSADDVEQLAELARLCARLPLALRIAAERAASHPHMRLDELIADLRDESGLWDALSTGSEEEAEAVRTVFAWSYRALSEPAARLFRLLGLHPGVDFGLNSAAVVADLNTGKARQLLDDLVGAHLLEQTAPDRYQFHDLLRAYATDQAQTEESPEDRLATLRRLLTWYLHAADTAQDWISPSEDHLDLPRHALDSVDLLTFPDYNAAVDWTERELDTHSRMVSGAAGIGDDRLTWQLADTLWQAWPPSAARADWTGIGHAGADAAAREQEPVVRLRLLTRLGMAYRGCARYDDGMECLRLALELARTTQRRSDEARVRNVIGLIHLRKRELNLASAQFREAAAILRDLGGQRLLGSVHANVAAACYRAGELTEAASALRLAEDAHRASGDRGGIGNVLRLRAELHLAAGRRDEAMADAWQAMDIALSLRDHTLEAYWLITLGDAQRATSAHGDALASFQRSAMLHRRLGDRSREALAWRGTALTYAATGRGEEAAGFLRQAAAAHRALGDGWEEAVDLDHLAGLVAEDDARAHLARVLELIAPYGDPRAEALRGRARGAAGE
ncbi:ATP-binding protein [Streptomyces sp. NPDC021224]|uniref:ATP-binding protein n=1 Tax=unclassified Streptomyces TaxID=2593676 RepID=UPI0037AAB324